MSSIYALIIQRSSSQRDMPAERDEQREAEAQHDHDERQFDRDQQASQQGAEILDRDLGIEQFHRGPRKSDLRVGACSGLQLIEHQVAVTQAVFLQDVADLPVGPHLRQRLRIGRAQRAVLLAECETCHAVATTVDDRGRGRDAQSGSRLLPALLLANSR